MILKFKKDSLQPLIEKMKKSKAVFTNGCFDILHVGHARYLTHAASLADFLIVGVNSDASVKRLKGESRPIVPEQERAEMLTHLKGIEAVVIFDEETPLDLITQLNPNILVKGGDWPVKSIVGHEFVLANGGIVKSLPFEDGYSTTNIIETIESRSKS
ncbi:MAG: D-glycero-beta-D-manno-heptose 1-phosphate adenylyltransferase [Candidatus Cloacimonadota bacterium]|nr:MAG: D-glycero-beta-D-manno-heptose 1-phosphate adenylyltransferase [Candidatus Cloacimonadota bacterium]